MEIQRKIPNIGIAVCVMYFISIGVFLITQSETALTIWEILTIIGALALLIILAVLAELMKIEAVYKGIMLVFMSCTCSLTGLAHVVNIAVTRRLIAEGVAVPDYFRIGCWPSAEMAIDYLAWGFFMGLAFLTIGLEIHGDEKAKKTMKATVLACSALCMVGFLGAIFVHEGLWYAAPIGYGLGPIVICIQMQRYEVL